MNVEDTVIDGVVYRQIHDNSIEVRGISECERDRCKNVNLRSNIYKFNVHGDEIWKFRLEVRGIVSSAFMQGALEKIWIPRSVEIIGDSCFRECEYLREIKFECGSKLRYVGKEAFRYCDFGGIELPSSVEYIGESCFEGIGFVGRKKHIQEITFESGSKLEHIETRAFCDSSLICIQIPASVKFIGESCFAFSRSLREITFECESSLEEIGDYAFSGTSLTHIEIPARCKTLTGLSLIGVKNVKICKDNPFFILDGGFLKSSDKTILIRYLRSSPTLEINQFVEIISAGCFCDCRFVNIIKFESGSKLRRIERYAFQGSGIIAITIPSSVAFIGESCFFPSQCHFLKELTFEYGSKLQCIEKKAFGHTRVKAIKIPSNVEFIGKLCFHQCKFLKEVTFDSVSKLRRLTKDAFKDSGIDLDHVLIPVGAELVE
jgi:hypothetical protein